MRFHEAALLAFAFAAAIATLLVVARLLWCIVVALGNSTYRIAFWSAACLGGYVALLLFALFWWFALAVSHRQKDLSDTYTLMAATGIPYLLASIGLWWQAGRFVARSRSAGAQPSPPPDDASRGA